MSKTTSNSVEEWANNPKNDKIAIILNRIFKNYYNKNSGLIKSQFYNKLGDAIYPYFEIINFIGSLLLFSSDESLLHPYDDLRSLRILNLIEKI